MKNPDQAPNRMFLTLGCLAMLAISAPACDPDGVEDLSELDELATLDIEDANALPSSEGLAVDSPEGLPVAPELIANASATPNLNDVWIESVSAFGVGCPNVNSTLVDVSSDLKSFLIAFKSMLLTNPGGSPVKTTNCVASIKLHIPGGWQVSVATINTRGYAYLEPGVKARTTTNYFFAGNPVGYEAHAELKGPYDGLYVFTDQVPFQSVVWSACGTSSIFAIDTSLVLNAIANPWGLGIFNNTTIDGRFHKVLHLQWKQC